MRAFTARRDAATPDELWIVEHRTGVHARPGRAARAPAGDRRDSRSSPRTAGGQVTYHGPGQVVVYTLIDLRRLGIFVKELVYRDRTVGDPDARGCRRRRPAGARAPGVYVPYGAGAAGAAVAPEFAGLAKIAALGVKISRGCSYHGVALNVAMDLAPFGRIDPCGYAGLQAVDLATLGDRLVVGRCREPLSRRLAAHLSPAALSSSPRPHELRDHPHADARRRPLRQEEGRSQDRAGHQEIPVARGHRDGAVAQAGVDPRPRRLALDALLRDQEHPARAPLAHGVRGSVVPEHRRVFWHTARRPS